MSYFAYINASGIVQQVIEADPAYVSGMSGAASYVETSINGSLRKQYAGIGYTYHLTGDAFSSPQPYPSWVLDTGFNWQAPISQPVAISGYAWSWNETGQFWTSILIT